MSQAKGDLPAPDPLLALKRPSEARGVASSRLYTAKMTCEERCRTIRTRRESTFTMPDETPPIDVQAEWARLAREVRTGVLLTMRNGRPFGSHVPYVFGANWTRAYVHLSRLALHTQHLLRDSRLSLFVSEPDAPGKNPLALRRMNLQGTAAVVPEPQPEYGGAKQRYLDRFPQSSVMFGFGDFDLWELALDDAHLVLGFGQAYQACASAPMTWLQQAPESKRNRNVQEPSSGDEVVDA